MCISEKCRIFASEKETNNKLNPKTRKGTEIMKTSTNKEINGWRNIFTPKNLKVKVDEWLLENGHDQDDAIVFEGLTFGDLKKCIMCKDSFGKNIINWDLLEEMTCYAYMDSYLRDVTFDALSSMKQ